MKKGTFAGADDIPAERVQPGGKPMIKDLTEM